MCFLLLGLCFLSNWFSTHTQIDPQPTRHQKYICRFLSEVEDMVRCHPWVLVMWFPGVEFRGKVQGGGAPYDRYNMGLFDP